MSSFGELGVEMGAEAVAEGRRRALRLGVFGTRETSTTAKRRLSPANRHRALTLKNRLRQDVQTCNSIDWIGSSALSPRTTTAACQDDHQRFIRAQMNAGGWYGKA